MWQAVRSTGPTLLPMPCGCSRTFRCAARSARRGAALTMREREIAQHIVTGATSKQIARLLEISHRTVEAHRARLMRKLDATTTGELVARLLGHPG